MTAPSTPDSWINQLIGEGRYRLQERLGGGSMGNVFIALDTRIGQTVAVKILKSHWAETEALRRRFEHEVAVCAALKGEHIVQIRDYGVTANGYPYYVMDYLVGQTLGDLMRQQGRLPVNQAVNLIIQVCSGLERAHTGIVLPNRGEMIKVVHRDLKPDNIFIAETSIGALVKILDFGIAKIQNMQRDSTIATNMFIGTFHYASPEQVEVSKQLDGRSDIYSLGVILYEMLSGANPFGLDAATGEISQMTWAVAHASKPVIPLRSQPGCDRLSPQLEAIVMRCLEKNPQDRFATVQELRQVLQAVLQTETAEFETSQSKTQKLDVTESASVGTLSPTPADPQPRSSDSCPPDQDSSRSSAPPPAPPAVSPDSEQETRSPSPRRPLPLRRSSLLPVALGFLVAIGLSGAILWQLLPKSSTSPPSQGSALPQNSVPDSAALPAMVCDEVPLREVSGEPALQQTGFKYYGTLENGQFAGEGTVIYDSNFRYDGEFQNSKKQGCGRFTYPPNDPLYREYIGQFQNDFPNGIGKLVFVNGAEYIGQIKTEGSNLYCQGEGVMILNDGNRIEGTWEKNKHEQSQGKYACNTLPPQSPI